MIHLWSHDIGAASGGIQSYTLALARALESLVGANSVKIHLKHEREPPPQIPEGMAVRGYGSVPKVLRTLAFSAGVMLAALRERPRLILSCHPNFAPIGIALQRTLRVPFWTAAHGIDVWEDCPRRVARALRNSDRVLAVSQFTRRKLIELHGLNEGRVSVLANTFDATRFHVHRATPNIRDQLRMPLQGPLLLSVGRLAEPGRMKGFDRVIQAMPRILERIPDATYVIGGKGPDLPRLQRLASECGVADRVRFAGFIPDDRLPAYYQACDAFVLPSKREGFGIVYLEALACGLPVIAGNVDASGEALLGGELGMLVNPDDIGEIAEACICLLARSAVRPSSLDPDGLSHRVTEAFGPKSFSNSLRGILDNFAPRSVSSSLRPATTA